MPVDEVMDRHAGLVVAAVSAETSRHVDTLRTVAETLGTFEGFHRGAFSVVTCLPAAGEVPASAVSRVW